MTKMRREQAARWNVGGRLLAFALLLQISACGFPRPADVELDGSSGDSRFQLLAIEPEVAATGDSVLLEGTFGSTLMVNFPGGSSVAAKRLGEHRAMVLVPDTAVSGALSVITDGSIVGDLAFHRTAYPLDLQPFQASPDQANGARQEVALAVARSGATSATIGNYVYVVGGMGSMGYLGSVERARVNVDGTLGGFSPYPVSLTTPRAGHVCVVIGVFVYVLGGAGSAGPLDSIERAMIAPDGSLGQFTTVPGRTLAAARTGSTGVVIGNALYVIGGAGNGVLSSVERATIAPNGALEPFAVYLGTTLLTSRTGHTATIVGDGLYVIGGSSSSGVVGSVERAAIAGDSALGGFVSVAGSLGTPRSGHTSVRFGNSLYVLGGIGTGGALASVEQSAIQADGSIGPFGSSWIGSLARARGGAVHVTSRGNLYLLGGTTSDGTHSSRAEQASLNGGGDLGAFSLVPDARLVVGTVNLIGAVVNGPWLQAFTTGMIEQARIHDDGAIDGFAPVAGATLEPSRGGYAIAEIADNLYILGGSDANNGDSLARTVLRAPIGSDGALGAFSPVPGVSLVNPHVGARTVVLGDHLYVIGGHAQSATVRNNVEVAPIGADGSLGPFSVSDPLAGNGCDACESIVVGKSLYLISGFGQSNIVQGAAINDDGTLGRFTPISAVTTVGFRGQAAAIALGPYLYLIGGGGVQPDEPDVERAPILADGTLGAFSPVAAGTGQRSGWLATPVGDRCYLLGGSQGLGYTTDIAQAALR